jgi:hypothetical protein
MALPQRGKRCGTCFYWRNPGSIDGYEEEGGDCCRYAPRPNDETSDDNLAIWPVTLRTSWCGDYKPDEDDD